MYIIFAPPYRHNSGGIKVLYELSYQLNKHGCESYVFVWDGGYYASNKYQTCSYEFVIDKIGKGAWVIYPEIVSGNPLNAKNVIRYVLNEPGKIGGDKVYDSSELIFAHSNGLAQFAPKGHILQTPHIELDLFKNNNIDRKGTCFWVGKGQNVTRKPELEELEITYTYPESREELVYIFNTKEVFYTYDDFTCVIDEAGLCGCPVVLLNDNSNKTGNLKENKNGLAFGISELEYAKKTIGKFNKLYTKQHLALFEKQLKSFIKLTNLSINGVD
jgi:O-antigen biosynthesis protein